MCPVSYDADAQCPTWLQFLHDIFEGDADLIDFLQCAAGYTLTGDTREEVIFILNGCGSNGKSTLITVMRDILGDYQRKTSTETLIEKKNGGGVPNDVAALRGARFVSAVETSAGKRLAEALVKELTGRDAISARFLHKEFFEFVPIFKLWLACNHVPSIQGQDYGIWRRIRLVPFNVRYYDPHESPVGPYKDKTLADRLRAEHPGILAWLVRGCLEWQRRGLVAPRSVILATSTLQENMDILGGFLSECCVILPHAEVQAGNLYKAYLDWAEKNGEKPTSQRWFGLRLSERGIFSRERRRDGMYWLGLGLVDSNYQLLPDNNREPCEPCERKYHISHNAQENSNIENSPYICKTQNNSSQGSQGTQNLRYDRLPYVDGDGDTDDVEVF
jgi:putative DNA primase/helicase